jgi:hypothetical protein
MIHEAQERCFEVQWKLRQARVYQKDVERYLRELHLATMHYFKLMRPLVKKEDEYWEERVLSYSLDENDGLQVDERGLKSVENWEFRTDTVTREKERIGRESEEQKETVPKTMPANVATSVIDALNECATDLGLGPDVDYSDHETELTEENIEEARERLRELEKEAEED